MSIIADVPFELSEISAVQLPCVKILDVGASRPQGHVDVYERLMRAGLCRIVGFEASAEECRRLNAQGDPFRQYLPYYIGDGEQATFHLCSAPMTSSLLAPNVRLLDQFRDLPELVRVVAETSVNTVRLDDIPEAHDADFVKLDVQGAELAVIAGAPRTLSRVVIVQSEVEFAPLYREQPLFSDVDTAMRRNGFALHRLIDIQGRSFAPLVLRARPYEALSQLLWADAVYVRSLFTLEDLDAPALLKLAVILHEVYGSFDLVVRCLEFHDRAAGTTLAQAYLDRIVATRPELAVEVNHAKR